MKLSKAFGVDAKKEREGTWIPISEDARVKIARFNNPEHRKVMDELRKPYRGLLIGGRDLPEDVTEEIILQSLSRAVLVDWEGFESEEGEPLPYSSQAAYDALAQYRDFRDMVSAVSMEVSHFREEDATAIAGN